MLLAVLALPLTIPASFWNLYTFGQSGDHLSQVEGQTGVATITWDDATQQGEVRVNGALMSALPDHPKHVRLAGAALALPRRGRLLVLGLGGGGMIRELVKDPAITAIDVVDWSYELPLVLAEPQARALLADALQHPKVRLIRSDARVVVSLYPPQTFDVVIDNLAVAGWAGSTNIKSLRYFREIGRILQPNGVFVFDPNYYPPVREAILAALLAIFPHVQEHQSSLLVLASAQPISWEPTHVEAILTPRAASLGLTRPYADWLLKGLRPIKPQMLNETPPLVDEGVQSQKVTCGSTTL